MEALGFFEGFFIFATKAQRHKILLKMILCDFVANFLYEMQSVFITFEEPNENIPNYYLR